MFDRSPLWPAQLDHIRIDSEQPALLISFYRDAMGMTPVELDDGTVLMQAPARRILIGRGVSGAQPFMAFKLQTEHQLDALRRHVSNRGLKALPSPTAIFTSGAFAIRDPDGRLAVFGLPHTDLPFPDQTALPAAKLPGRLQHVVVASTELAAMLRFYEEDLGFVVSDYVFEDDSGGEPTAGFFSLRSGTSHVCGLPLCGNAARPSRVRGDLLE